MEAEANGWGSIRKGAGPAEARLSSCPIVSLSAMRGAADALRVCRSRRCYVGERLRTAKSGPARVTPDDSRGALLRDCRRPPIPRVGRSHLDGLSLQLRRWLFRQGSQPRIDLRGARRRTLIRESVPRRLRWRRLGCRRSSAANLSEQMGPPLITASIKYRLEITR